jgi:hypothetical protein
MNLFLKRHHLLEHLGPKEMVIKHLNDAMEVSGIMLATMTYELQKQHKKITMFDMIQDSLSRAGKA